jgi:hypothetical protein
MSALQTMSDDPFFENRLLCISHAALSSTWIDAARGNLLLIFSPLAASILNSLGVDRYSFLQIMDFSNEP